MSGTRRGGATARTAPVPARVGSPSRTGPAAAPDRSAPRQVPAVRRALSILFHLGSATQRATLSQIARDVDVLPSTCLHILRALVAEGMVDFDPATKSYALGSRVLTLAHQFGRRNRFVEVARPLMEAVARELSLELTAHECDGLGHIVVVAGTEIVEDMQLRIPPGQRVPILAGASGRLIAAFHGLPEARLRELFARVRWQKPLPYARWREQVEAARVAGYGIDDGWSRPGITMIAVPVRTGAAPPVRFIGAIDVSDGLTPARRGAVVRALKAAAARIGERLAWPG